MPYDSIRDLLRERKHKLDAAAETAILIEAIERLTAAIESDMTQIKAALSHVAGLLEADGGAEPTG